MGRGWLASQSAQKDWRMKDFDEMFYYFWQSGLRKRNKIEAKKKLFALIKSIPEADRWKFIVFLREDIKLRLIGQFGFSELHPTTYINGERWEDERPKERDRSTRDISIQEQLTDTTWAKK